MTDPSTTGRRSEALFRPSVSAAVVGGVFSAAVAVVLVVTWARMSRADLANSADLAALKAELFARPGEPELLERIRRLDLQLRSDYFARRRRLKVGGWMLLAGAAVALAGVRFARAIRPDLPSPGPAPALGRIEHRTNRLGRWLVGGVAAGCVAAVAAVAFLYSPVALVSDVRYPTYEEYAANWPRFRGAGGSGVSAHADAPMRWDARTGEGILWKTPIPLPGKSSPVVWGNRVFCTGATMGAAEVFCFDADDGKLLWRRPVKTASTPAGEDIGDDTGYAAPTAAVDGQRVYAAFPNGDLACLNFRGAVLWTRSEGVPDNTYGHASSLAIHENLLIVQRDQGQDPEQGLSEIMGVEGATGKVVWIEARPVKSSWTTPIIARTPTGSQLITSADPWVIAYDPATGLELWRAKLMAGDVAPSPIYSGGLVLVVHSEAVLAAIRTDGSGDVTETHVAWTADDGLPDITSPVADGTRVYLVNANGLLSCYRIADGKKLWEKELDGAFNASPSLVGDRIYLIDQRGRCLIVAAADAYRSLGEASLNTRTAQEGNEQDDPDAEQGAPETFSASPAFMDGRIYIRGSQHLYCIGARKP
ncbi:MAG TPA: PQQ-binding-like beta-propeller repeat protein [Phycisphaerae bacterium]|nr:PQQ-binding-like beta-propeller repeat protein [Phycisphaerae bacterium]